MVRRIYIAIYFVMHIAGIIQAQKIFIGQREMQLVDHGETDSLLNPRQIIAVEAVHLSAKYDPPGYCNKAAECKKKHIKHPFPGNDMTKHFIVIRFSSRPL